MTPVIKLQTTDSFITDGQCGEFQFAAADGYDGTLQGFFTLPADLYVDLLRKGCYRLC